MLTVVALLVGVVAGSVVTAIGLRFLGQTRVRLAEEQRTRLLEDATRDAEALRRESQVEAREQAVQLRAQIESEVGDRRAQITKAEERLLAREEETESKLVELSRREQGIADRETHARELQEELKTAKDAELAELQRVAGLTINEAKQHVLERSEDLVRHELARTVRQLEE